MSDVSDLQVRPFVEATTTRLISTAYIDEPALAPLADDEDDLAFLAELEGRSSSRRGLPGFIPAGVHPDELVTAHHGYGWTYVNAAFCYTRETGNRFSGPERGAWYATWGEDRVETAQSEVGWHLTQELHATGVYDNVTAYRELNASFATEFHDLNGADLETELHPDPIVGYPAGQRLAARYMAAGSNGFLFPSVRRSGGACLAAFRPHMIQNVRQGDTWVFTWSGQPEPDISAGVS
ncbi:RES family NAD+ phosphorylase [uncultured Tateyamaria sp.]|uniref:RES family NAD+ phosphorylase n=1 Tax=uncultured Tateyamaria sp. TaxID=455651 RepID=UPI002628461A|nr:RES family NAD+ phosphorylase [uncultured Tateyamaria sp.]